MNIEELRDTLGDLFSSGEHQSVVWMVSGYCHTKSEGQVANIIDVEILLIGVESVRRKGNPLCLLPMLPTINEALGRASSGEIEIPLAGLKELNSVYFQFAHLLDSS